MFVNVKNGYLPEHPRPPGRPSQTPQTKGATESNTPNSGGDRAKHPKLRGVLSERSERRKASQNLRFS